MSAGTLTSNHVNYLIWRYLQESGHGQAAAKFQASWREDPETLPFARHIKTHALIHLVQKGLQYYELEQSIDQYGRRRSPSPSASYFGPQVAQEPATPNGDDGDEDEAICTSASSQRPRQRKAVRKGPPENGYSYESEGRAVKRSRHSGNTAAMTNGNVNKGGDDMAMDVDQDGRYPANHHAEANIKHDAPGMPGTSPSSGAEAALATNTATGTANATAGGMDLDAAELEAGADEGALQVQPMAGPPTPTPTLTNGRSVGVQSDKVAELGPGTTVLRVPDTNVTHAAWNPRDPQLLATGGSTLCRLWTLAQHAYATPTPSDPEQEQEQEQEQNDSAKPYSHADLFPLADLSYVTSMAWSPDGEHLAIARYRSEPSFTGTISICTKGGAVIDELPGGREMVLNLSWNPPGSLILGITHSDDVDSTLIVWDAKSARPMQPFQLKRAVMDAAWTDDHKFVVCGTGLIAESHIEDYNIDALESHRYSTDIPYEWSKIRYDPITRTIAVATEASGDLAIINSLGNMHIHKAHDAEITGLVYQPLANSSAYPESSARLLATSSIDGSINIWDARRPFELVQSFSFGRASPALAMSFSPDGYLVAASSWDKIMFWKAEGGALPMATWRGKNSEWQGTLDHPMNGDRGEEDDELQVDTHCLSWDAYGKKLAYGFKDQIAIINFLR
ncbi:hypothetical protein MMC13_005191 [Lambiella insularis]|nr:hypothetical protein [Lambiella insularis]